MFEKRVCETLQDSEALPLQVGFQVVFLSPTGYCSAQCPTMWSTQPYQNSSDLDLSDTTNTPLGFLNDFLPEREISTELLTICVDVNVPGASNSRANYVFVAVSSYVCICQFYIAFSYINQSIKFY